MAKIAYTEKRFNRSTLEMLTKVNMIIDEYLAQGFNLTLRQIYYQLVARDLFPDDRTWTQIPGTNKWVKDLVNGTKNAEPNYKWVGEIISEARKAGLVDWEAIIDRTRSLKGNSHWASPSSILRSAELAFAVDKWAGQEYRPEVWVEKDALVGVVERACAPLDVNFFACRGYSSDSEMWRAAQRFKNYANGDMDNPQILYIIHLGDHDPSGIDMTDDISRRLNLFGAFPIVKRIALNLEQIETYNPPPNPAKETDSRWANYVSTYNTENSWELDALEPALLVSLITSEVESIRDNALWKKRS